MSSEITWPRAIFLDFYGTVVEEAGEPIVQVCHEIVEASSKTPTLEEVNAYWSRVFGEACFNSHGNSFRCERELEQASLQEVLLHFDADLDSAQLTQSLYDYWTRPMIFPESRDVLARCSVPVCLVSNVDNADLASALKYNNLSFDLIVTSEDCRAYKPRPEPFEKALSLLRLSSEEVLHVGDSLSCDVRGAKAYGIPALWINKKGKTLPAGYEQPEYVSTDLTGILDILNSS